jgi:hypothetical protein
MYFVAKIEMQTNYITIHMKMTKFKCMCIGIHMTRNLHLHLKFVIFA